MADASAYPWLKPGAPVVEIEGGVYYTTATVLTVGKRYVKVQPHHGEPVRYDLAPQGSTPLVRRSGSDRWHRRAVRLAAFDDLQVRRIDQASKAAESFRGPRDAIESMGRSGDITAQGLRQVAAALELAAQQYEALAKLNEEEG